MANTGTKIILTLQEVLLPGMTPTGNTKPNDPLDPDYIAPTEDLTECPVTYTLSCAEVIASGHVGNMEYELSIKDSVLNNPSVDTLRVKLMSGVTPVGTTDFSFPNPSNYFDGSFSAAAGAYTIEVQYLDVSSTVLATCSSLASVTIT